ncbi:MAG: CinA family nicotinamide mononucleotide deamidase-related protein, partial [bacterium]|nr:CinA family nicotinamide mononucleotide deamidase-related protein [bacterium]
MKVEIITIGDEILIGQIVNTNAAYIAEKVTELGFDVDWITVVGDNAEKLYQAIALAESRSDIIIATGGLGPTHDDITKKVLARYFNSRLILDEPTFNKIKDRFRKRRIRMAKINREQAMVIDNAVVIENHAGSAPGMLIQKNDKYFFAMPGVPAEMVSIMESYIIPFLKKKQDKIFKKRVIHTTGIPESAVFEKLGNIEALERSAKIAFLPTYSGVNVRLSVQGATEAVCQEKIDQVEKVFQKKFHLYIWGYNDDLLENVVAKLLLSQNKTISIAEFGTNGNLTAQFTSAPLGNKVFVQGFTFGSELSLKENLDPDNNELDLEQIFSDKICKKLAARI